MSVVDLTHLARYGAFSPPKAASGAIAEILRKFAPALFATYNYKGGLFGGSNAGPVDIFNGLTIGSIKLDFGAIAAARSAAQLGPIAGGDVLQLFSVKAGTWVIAAFLQTTKLEGAGVFFGLGDGDDTTGYEFLADGNDIGWSSSLGTGGYNLEGFGGKVYTVDDTIDLLVNVANTDLCVLHITVVMVELARQRQ